MSAFFPKSQKNKDRRGDQDQRPWPGPHWALQPCFMVAISFCTGDRAAKATRRLIFSRTHTWVELMSEESTSLAPFSRCSRTAAVFAVFPTWACVCVCVSVEYHDIYRVFSCTGSCDILSSSACVHGRLEETFVLKYSDKLISCQTVV